MTFARADVRAYARTHANLKAELSGTGLDITMGGILVGAFGRDDVWDDHVAIHALRDAGYRPMAIVEHLNAARRTMNRNRARLGWEEI